jgi:hypothetical protein
LARISSRIAARLSKQITCVLEIEDVALAGHLGGPADQSEGTVREVGVLRSEQQPAAGEERRVQEGIRYPARCAFQEL